MRRKRQEKFKNCLKIMKQGDCFFDILCYNEIAVDETRHNPQKYSDNISMVVNMNNLSGLIVDDQIAWCHLLRGEFDKLAFFNKIECVHNGRDALQYIHQNRPDVIILDLVLPEYDGLYIVSYIRTQLTDYNPYIYILSAISTSRTNEILSDLNISYYSVKPIRPEVVANNVRILAKIEQPNPVKEPLSMINNLDPLIEDYLIRLGVPMFLISTKCTMAALRVLIENPLMKSGEKVYKEVAEIMSTTSSAVERNIRSSIKRMQQNETLLFLQIFPTGQENLTNIKFLRIFTSYFLREAGIQNHDQIYSQQLG